MDEIYRGYRIAVTEKEKWIGKVWSVRGGPAPMVAEASAAEGPAVCATRARELVDRYIKFLAVDPDPDD